MGKLLVVDLDSRRIQAEPLNEEMVRHFLGGYGLGASMIYSRQRAGVDPLGAENILGMLTGPCSGTDAIVGSRFMVVGKSPLTGTWGDSDCGGYLGPELKFAGFDGILFAGIADSPLYLLVDHGEAELRDASHLWGKDTTETEDVLRAELGKSIKVACIGPAGERLSRISCIVHDKGRAAGRSGFGAVMGAKKLKAIAATGDMKVPVADAARLRDLRKKYLAQLKESEGARSLRTYGTCASLSGAVETNAAPIKNWSGVGLVDFPTAKRISDENVIRHEVRKYACYHCPIACGGHVAVAHGPYAAVGHKPEYETLASFGAMTLNDNVESIIKLNDLCNRAGLDTISAGSTIAFAMECYEKGLITGSDTGGIELRWTDAEAIVSMVRKMVKREGLGDILADGVKAAAARIGKDAEDYAVHCAGQEPGMMDSNYWRGLGMSYQLDATPGRHGQGGHWMTGMPDWWKERLGVEDLPSGENRQDYVGKGEVFKRAACMLHFIHCSGLCRFPWYYIDPASMWEFVSLVTGWHIDGEEAYRIGERIANIRQAFNVREGFNALEHPLHPRMFRASHPGENQKEGVATDMDTLVREFLTAMDWDLDTAKPTREKLASLGLEQVAGQLRWTT